MAHKNHHEYVAVLFYASWCPFSQTFRPVFSALSFLYPSIPHVAIEESAITPRYFSDYFYVHTDVGIKFYLAGIINSDIYLQYTIKIWSSWVSYSFSLKFFHARTVPWFSNT